jgi:hypothetical protein
MPTDAGAMVSPSSRQDRSRMLFSRELLFFAAAGCNFWHLKQYAVGFGAFPGIESDCDNVS